MHACKSLFVGKAMNLVKVEKHEHGLEEWNWCWAKWWNYLFQCKKIKSMFGNDRIKAGFHEEKEKRKTWCQLILRESVRIQY